MNPYSLEFLVILFVSAALFFRLPSPGARQAAFAAASLGFLYTYLPNPLSWAALALFLWSGHAVARVLRSRPNRFVLGAYLVFLVGVFVVLKKYDIVRLVAPARLLESPIAIVGLSYMLFRQIHFLVDSMQGQIERASLWDYVNYQINFFTLLAGPIQRFQDFQDYWDRPRPLLTDRHEILRGYRRLFLGILKVVVVSELFQTLCNRFHDRLIAGSGPVWHPGVLLVVYLYSFLMYLYFNFSGYCDVVIAGSSLVGLRLPENFDQPFLARNILDYWSRWHITLGHWIRDYIFLSFYKSSVERWPSHGKAAAVTGYFVAFTLAGVWHGSTWNYLLYGLLHGAGASASKLWETGIVARSGRKGLKTYLESTTVRWVATLCTFHYACFTLLFFALDLGQIRAVLGLVLGTTARGY